MPFGPRKLRYAFSGQTLTHFGGVYLLHRFLNRVRLKRLLTTDVRFPQRNNHYRVSEMVLALIYPMMLGLERLEATHLLRHNGVFQYLTGLPVYPNPTTLRRFLLHMAPSALPKLRKLHDRLLQQRLQQSTPRTRFIFDLDSTVVVLYGKQEEARVGYNPHKRGRPSYHPLLCFEGHTKDFWHGGTPSRRHPHQDGHASAAGGVLCQTPSNHAGRGQSRRQRVLRPQAHRVARGARRPVCRGRSVDPTAEAETCGLALHRGPARDRHRRTGLSAPWVAEAVPLCGHPQAQTRGSHRPALVGPHRPVCLPGLCDQFGSAAPQPLAVLQWASCCGAPFAPSCSSFRASWFGSEIVRC
jgi:hypothetical protein